MTPQVDNPLRRVHRDDLTRARILVVMHLDGVTGRELARRIGVSESWVSRLLTGDRLPLRRRSPHIKLAQPIERVAQALGRSISELEHGDPCPLCDVVAVRR